MDDPSMQIIRCPACGVVKLNVDGSPALASRFNIMSVPFLFVFGNGQLKESMPGGLQPHEIMMKMAPYI